MLDTITIKLERHNYKILEPARFSPNAGIVNNPQYSGKCVYNPTRAEKRKGYFPRLTLFKMSYGEGRYSVWLKIEFSAPKLIFGNNFEELTDGDFERVILALKTALKGMGIEVSQQALSEGKITGIHYSKNLLLGRHVPCLLLMQMFEKADMSKRLDVSKSLFRNGGQMVSYHAKYFEIVLYDKIRDMEQAQKFGASRGAEKDYPRSRMLTQNARKGDVLRLEVRLRSKKLKILLTTMDSSPIPLTMESLFNAQISRVILLYYWDAIVGGMYAMHLEGTGCDKLIRKIQEKFPRKRPSTVSSLTGFLLASQQLGVPGARLLLGLSDAQFYKLKGEAKQLSPNMKDWRFSALGKIREQLNAFSPLNEADFRENLGDFLRHHARAYA